MHHRSGRRRAASAILSAALLGAATTTAHATPTSSAAPASPAFAAGTGTVDLTWSGDGYLQQYTPYSVAVGHDGGGRFVSAIYTERRMGITTYEADGTAAAAPAGASVTAGFASTGVSVPTQVEATASGIAVIGEYYGSTARLGVMKVRSDGRFDGTFSGDGKKLHKVFNSEHDVVSAFRAEVLPDGRMGLAVAAYDYDADGWLQFTGQSVIVLRTDGTLDPSFSGDGRLPLPNDYSDVGFLPDGGLYVGRHVGVVHEVHKLLPSGAPDGSFSGDGVTAVNCKTHRGAYLTDDPAGRPVLMCLRDTASTLNLGVFRFTTSGEPDLTYSGDGKTSMVLAGGTAKTWALDFDEAGLPWAAIRSATDAKAFLVYTLDASGAPNAAWSEDGVATVTTPKAVALDSIMHVGDRVYVGLWHFPDPQHASIYALTA